MWIKAAIFLMIGCLPAAAGELTVFAAASLKTALDEIAPRFEAASGHRLTVSLAGSSLLARQIVVGAPADIFISANQQWADYVEAEGLVIERFDLLTNELEVVVPIGAGPAESGRLVEILTRNRLAMAQVDAAPAGIYGKAALESLGLWGTVSEHVVQTDNVRTALALVARGEVGAGVVYKSDERAEPRVRRIAGFPENSHPPIVYPLAILQEGAAMREFVEYLRGTEARGIFEKQGFGVPEFETQQ